MEEWRTRNVEYGKPIRSVKHGKMNKTKGKRDSVGVHRLICVTQYRKKFQDFCWNDGLFWCFIMTWYCWRFHWHCDCNAYWRKESHESHAKERSRSLVQPVTKHSWRACLIPESVRPVPTMASTVSLSTQNSLPVDKTIIYVAGFTHNGSSVTFTLICLPLSSF